MKNTEKYLFQIQNSGHKTKQCFSIQVTDGVYFHIFSYYIKSIYVEKDQSYSEGNGSQ